MDILMTVVITCLSLIAISFLFSIAIYSEENPNEYFSKVFPEVLAWLTGIVFVVGLIALLSIGIYIEFM